MPIPKLEPGQICRFSYLHTRRDAASGDPFKEVFVLNPNWRGQLHAIDLKRLTAAEREILQAIMDPQWRTKQHRLPLVNDINRRMNPIEDIRSPMSFYVRFVRQFLRNKDAYRRYFLDQMTGVTVVCLTTVQGGVVNPKPLFQAQKPAGAKLGRMTALGNVARRMFGKLFKKT